MTRDDVIKAFAAYYESAGYGTPPPAILDEEFDGMQELIAGWPVDAVVERRLANFQVRMIKR